MFLSVHDISFSKNKFTYESQEFSYAYAYNGYLWNMVFIKIYCLS